MVLSHILMPEAALEKSAAAMRALLVKTIGFGPEVEPEVKVMRASFLPPKMFFGMCPLYFSAILVMGCLSRWMWSRAETSMISV